MNKKVEGSISGCRPWKGEDPEERWFEKAKKSKFIVCRHEKKIPQDDATGKKLFAHATQKKLFLRQKKKKIIIIMVRPVPKFSPRLRVCGKVKIIPGVQIMKRNSTKKTYFYLFCVLLVVPNSRHELHSYTV